MLAAPLREGCLVSPFVCDFDSCRCRPGSGWFSSTVFDCERLLVGNSSLGLRGEYIGSLEILGACGAALAGIKLVGGDAPGGLGAGRPGTKLGWIAAGELGTKLPDPGTLRGMGGGGRGFSKLFS